MEFLLILECSIVYEEQAFISKAVSQFDDNLQRVLSGSFILDSFKSRSLINLVIDKTAGSLHD